MSRHFEKMAQGLGEQLLSPLQEGTERSMHRTHEGSECVDWDMPLGPHMINGSGHHAPTKPHKPHKPPVAQKPQPLKKSHPIANGVPRGYRSGSHGRNNGYSADEEDPGANIPNKKRVKVPEPSLRIDPRQPVLKVKKVQGSAWRPVPINRAIESSSEESDDSSCSDDTVIAASNTDTLRSAHV